MYGICELSLVPCRKEPSDKSEMVTQLLFGELLTILSKEKDWYRIKNAFDNYESWVDKKQVRIITDKTFQQILESPLHFSGELIQVVQEEQQEIGFPILIGSHLPIYKNHTLYIEKNKYSFEGSVIKQNKKANKASIVDYAYMFINAPYLWGGRSIFGIDCSGFTQIVYRLAGALIKRDAYQQAEEGEALDFVEEAEPGDLAFFDNKEGKITHVGIVLQGNKIIHASGKVRVDTLDHHGIYNAEQKKYSHNLRVIKRVV